jgi:hypothetical protein
VVGQAWTKVLGGAEEMLNHSSAITDGHRMFITRLDHLLSGTGEGGVEPGKPDRDDHRDPRVTQGTGGTPPTYARFVGKSGELRRVQAAPDSMRTSPPTG